MKKINNAIAMLTSALMISLSAINLNSLDNASIFDIPQDTAVGFLLGFSIATFIMGVSELLRHYKKDGQWQKG
ncbi:MAG: hypothetical protein AAFX87_15760 [Bacteroidota bacterium]